MDLSAGRVIELAQANGLPSLLVTVLAAGDQTVKYRDPNGVIRTLRKSKFINRARRAAGQAPIHRRGSGSGSIYTISTPMGGQTRRR